MARLSILNRGEIVTQGLEEGGNPGITLLANTFLNNFLDEVYAAYDWPFLLKEESITISTSAVSVASLSETYRKTKAIHLDDSDFELQEWKFGFTDLRRRIRNADRDSQTNEPLFFFPDPDTSLDQIHVFPVPDKSFPATLWYYFQPAELTADANVPTLPSASLMVAAVADFAARYDREDTQIIMAQNVRKAVRELRRNIRDFGQQRMDGLEFDRNFHNWRRLR